MKKIFMLFALGSISWHCMAQEDIPPADTSWKKGGVIGLNFTQIALDNWAAGGQSSIAGTALINVFANYKEGKVVWDNMLDLAYGINNFNNSPYWIKTDDKIDISSKLGREAGNNWYYSGLINFKTQFSPGYLDPNAPPDQRVLISDFMAPAYMLVALGMDYRPSDDFTVFISPVTVKTTIVNNQTLADAGAFGVDEADINADGTIVPGTGSKIRAELGGYLKMMWRKRVMENISFQTKLDLFSNYLEHPENIDINWENLIAMKVNNLVSVTLATHLIYDHDIKIARDEGGVPRIGPTTQFKEVFNLGFNYKF